MAFPWFCTVLYKSHFHISPSAVHETSFKPVFFSFNFARFLLRLTDDHQKFYDFKFGVQLQDDADKFDDVVFGSHTGQYSRKMTCLCVNGSVYTSPFSSYKIVTTTTVDENDLSTGFSISYGQFIYLTCGDIGGKRGNQSGGCDGSYGCKFFDIETNVSALFAGGGGVSAYKTNHHGSRCSTNPKWVSDLKAPVAINSSGKYDNYKHPREEVVRELNNSPAMVNFFLTAPVNYYRRSLPPKGVLNPAPGRPIVLTVNRVNNDTPIIFKSIFNVQGVYYRKP